MEVASGNPLRHAHTPHTAKTVVYIIKKRRQGVRTWWTKKYKKSVRSIRIIRFFPLIMPPHAWGVKAYETWKSFFIFPPQHMPAWWKIFRVYFFLFVSRLRCVIKRFGYMFRQVCVYICIYTWIAADRKRHPSIPPPAAPPSLPECCCNEENKTYIALYQHESLTLLLLQEWR